jgi:hypothetical protein
MTLLSFYMHEVHFIYLIIIYAVVPDAFSLIETEKVLNA